MEEKSFSKAVVLSVMVLILFVNIIQSRHIKRSHTSKVHHKVVSERRRRQEVVKELEVDGTKFHSIGCFRDAWNRVIPALEGEHQLLMEPNYKARKFALLKCARAAMDKNLKIFGIENGGQCFGADEEKSLDKYGAAVECRRDGKGGPWSLQAYKFLNLETNGGFSPWSRWTTCSKTCDHGVRRRMRTCSNPPPSNGGKDCSGLGPSVEGEICKDKECPTVLIDEPEAGNTVRPTTSSTTPSSTPITHTEITVPTTAPTKNKEDLAAKEQSNHQVQYQTQTKGGSSELANKASDSLKKVGETSKPENEQGSQSIKAKAETSSETPSLQKDERQKNNPVSLSKEASEPVSPNLQSKNLSTKAESSHSAENDHQKNNPGNLEIKNSKESGKKLKPDSSDSPNEKQNLTFHGSAQTISQTGYAIYQDSRQTGSHVYQEPNPASSHSAPGSEPYQFIDDSEDQREHNNNLYPMASMHQSENLKAHEQVNLPGNSQEVDPSIIEDTYNGGPVVPSSAVQLNTPLGPVVMGEVNPMSSNFNPAEEQNDQPVTDGCFCPKKTCDAKADIVFLVDGSSDIPQIYFSHVLDFMKALTRGFVAKDNQVSLVAYGDDAASAFGFSPVANLREIDDGIDSMTYMGGDPRTGNALMKVKNGVFGMNSRKDSNHALVLLTSGSSSDDTIQAATELREAGIKLTTIGLGKLANVKELIDISSEPKSSHVFTAFLDTLPDIMDDIVKGVCSDINGKLYDKTEECLCENNKVKDAKQKSPGSSSSDGAKNPQKGSSLTSGKTFDNKNSKNQSKLNSNEGSKNNHEISNSEQNKSDSSSNEKSSKNTDSHEQRLKTDSKDKDTNEKISSEVGTSILKLPSEEKSNKLEQSQEKGPNSQEAASPSHEKESSKNIPIKEVKTDLKVDSPVPQVDKNEKAVPKIDDTKENKPSNGNPSEGATEGPPNGDKVLLSIPPAKEEPKSSKDNESSIKNEQQSSESSKEPARVPENTKGDSSKLRPSIGLFPLTPGEHNTDTSPKEPDRSETSTSTEQEQQNEIPTAAEETATESPAAPDRPMEPQPLKEQPETITIPPSKDEKTESNTLNKSTDEPKGKEHGKSKQSSEKIFEATESSFPPRTQSKPSEQPEEPTGQHGEGQKPAENSDGKELKNAKVIAQQVEVPNPSSKEPPSKEQERKASFDTKEGESAIQSQHVEPNNSYSQAQVAPQPPVFSMLNTSLKPSGDSSEQTLNGGRLRPTELSSSQQQSENQQNIKQSSNNETSADASSTECSVNLGVVLDSKTTAYGDDNNAKKLLQFAKKVTHMFPVSPEGNRVGMMVYSGSPKLKVVHFDHSLDANTMDRAIDSASYLNMEIKTGRVLNFAQEHLFSRIPSGKQNVLLLITDGVSYDDVTNPSLELKRRGVEIFAIGVGDNVVRKELESIASDAADDHVIMTSYDISDALLNDIKTRICSSAQRKGREAYLPRRRGHLYRVLTEIDRRRKRNQ